MPDAKDKTSTYDAYLARGSDAYDHGIYPGNVGVTIDRYSGKATVTYPTPADPSLAGEIEQDWFYGIHAGTFFSGWWRLVWLVLGAGAALNALVAGAGIALGGRPAEPAPFAGYVAVSVLAVPLGWRYARGSARGWDALTLALATLTLSVICVRLGRTWG